MQSLKKYEAGGIAVYDFMVGRLGLSGSELLVFAAIYSFSKGAEGEFFGTRAYLSQRIGASVRSISRSLVTLMERGLITRTDGRFKDLNNAVYRVNALEVEKQILDSEHCKEVENRQSGKASLGAEAGQNGRSIGQNGTIPPSSEGGQNGSTPVTNRHHPRDKMAIPPGQNGTIDNKDDNKEDNKEELSINPSFGRKIKREAYADEIEEDIYENWGRNRDEDIAKELEGRKYKILGMGKDELVPMTDKQYIALLRLAPAEVIDGYISKINNFTAYPNSGRVRNPYKTIQKWLKEDFEA